MLRKDHRNRSCNLEKNTPLSTGMPKSGEGRGAMGQVFTSRASTWMPNRRGGG